MKPVLQPALPASATMEQDPWLEPHPLERKRRTFGVDLAWPVFFVGLICMMVGFLVGPRISDDQQHDACLGKIHLPGPFLIHLNCDSVEFMSLATNPSGLLKKQNWRQSRPGIILAAAPLTALLSLLPKPDVPPPLPKALADRNPERIIDAFPRYLPAYLAYMLYNIVTLLFVFHFFRKALKLEALDPRSAAPIVASIGLLLVANDVSKAFAWSPHVQLFNILGPVIAVFATLRAWNGALAETRFAIKMGLIIGFGMTAYGGFAVVPAGIVVAGLLAAVREGKPAIRQSLINLGLLLALAALPSVAWYLFVIAKTGQFFSAEIYSGQIVWMFDDWAKHGMAFAIADWFNKFGQLILGAARQAMPLFALLLLIFAVTIGRADTALVGIRQVSAVIVVGIFISAMSLVFYTCVGFIWDRLAYPAIPSLIVATGALAIVLGPHLPQHRRQILVFGCITISVVNLIYVILKHGPFS
jgi:hypothetical protein